MESNTLVEKLITEENKSEIQNLVEEISIPRLLGTPNGNLVVTLIKRKFESIGIKLNEIPFMATRFWTGVYLRRAILYITFMAILIAISMTRDEIFTLFFEVVLVIYIIILSRKLTEFDMPVIGAGESFQTCDLRHDIPALNETKDEFSFEMRDTEAYKRKARKNGLKAIIEQIEDDLGNSRDSKKKLRKKKKEFKQTDKKNKQELEEQISNDFDNKLERKKIGAIILMAHHDSKSQPIKTYHRALLFTIMGLSYGLAFFFFLGISLLNLLNLVAITHNYFRIIAYIFTVSGAITAIPLMFNTVGNKSPGTMDNASGVATVFELTKYFEQHPLQNFRVISIITGAEEVSTLGSRYLAPILKEQLGNRPVYVLNYDMVGLKGEHVQYIAGSMMTDKDPIYVKFLEGVSKELEIPVNGFKFAVGAMTDGFVFQQVGFKTIDFINREAAFFTHTKHDSIDKFDAKNCLKFVAIGAALAEKLDKTIVEDPEILEKVSEKRSIQKLTKIRLHGFMDIKGRIRTNITQIVQEELQNEFDDMREEIINLISTAINTATGHLNLKFEKEIADIKKMLDNTEKSQ